MSTTADVAIVGGGIQGCATAFFLARMGVRAAVLEKDYVGRHASGVNAGGVRTLGRHMAEVPLALASRRLWEELPALLEDDLGFQVTGQLRVAETPAELHALRARVQALHEAGYQHETLVDAAALRELAPALAPHCLGAIHVPTDGHAEPYRTTRAFRLRAEALGARIMEGVAVIGMRRAAGCWRITLGDGRRLEAPMVLNCAGAWADQVGTMLGDALPIEANGSMQMVSARMPRFLGPVVGFAGRSLSAKQFANGTVVMGGGRRSPVLRDTNESTLDLGGLATAMRDAAAVIPPMAQASIVRFWSGIEGFTPDRIPIIGPGSQEGVFHAAGFSAHGFQLGPIIGQIMADSLTGRGSNLPIAPFALARFSGAAADG
ncbi:FAD-binding oxidoreductase [Roseomonas sp. CECT 9278]|uniref:NAD(P)/FAD-dependent oxidoreductase n=1 Tax=Roseomonas sp. CECT 9278 TaxID=2845823 RepID=UPI001E3D446A|nr:FAD-dependent oxidoreductase [Roseomonas sp. CECT 9278]CAH0161654.1 Hydrogen cyanide synthase subunit HcnC [Roseomonas sp. CECT 9278]